MEPEGSLLHSQVPATSLYPEPAQSSPYPPTSHFLKIRFNITLPSMRGSSQWSLSLGFPHQNPVHASSLPNLCYMPANLIICDFITSTILSEKYRSWSSSIWSFLYSPFTMSSIGPYILLNTLFSNSLSLHISLIVSDQVSRPYKTTDKHSTFRYVFYRIV
jgi:hypothetical protein